MKNEKTLNFSSKKEQLEGMNLEPEFTSRLAECLSNIKEKGIEGLEYTGRVTKEFVNQIAETFKQDKLTMEQKMKKALLRYIPKDATDGEKESIWNLFKSFIKDKPIHYFLLEKCLRRLGCDVTISKLERGSIEELEYFLEIGHPAVGL